VIQEIPVERPDVVAARCADTLSATELDRFRRRIRAATDAAGEVRLLLDVRDWSGWESLSALFEDLRADAMLHGAVSRLAVIGDSAWHAMGAQAVRPLLDGDVRYFTPEERPIAFDWIAG